MTSLILHSDDGEGAELAGRLANPNPNPDPNPNPNPNPNLSPNQVG